MATGEKVHRSISTNDRNAISDIAQSMANVFLRISMAFNTDDARREFALADPNLRGEMQEALRMTGAEMLEILFASVITADVLREYMRTHAILDGSMFEELEDNAPVGRWEVRQYDGKDEVVFVEEAID